MLYLRSIIIYFMFEKITGTSARQGLLPGATRLLVLEEGEEEEEEKGEGAGSLLLHIVPCPMSWISYPLVLSNYGGK